MVSAELFLSSAMASAMGMDNQNIFGSDTALAQLLIWISYDSDSVMALLTYCFGSAMALAQLWILLI